jgi:propanol-preferring alcohol dehydrogenase
MRAMVLEVPGPVRERPLALRELTEPVPGPGEIRVRVEACGVCHTDLHTVVGDLHLPRLPLVPGHQVVGRVDGAGQGATRFVPGARVGVPWLHWTCGSCRYCLAGRENLCAAARFTGLDASGGYAEALVVPEAFAYGLPESAAAESIAPLLCAGVIGYRALELAQVPAGGSLGLYGFGASAHLVIQLARRRGLEVWVCTRSDHHRALARELGAAWTGGAEEAPSGRLDGAILFAPSGALVPQALRALARGGVLALAGITMTAIPELEYALLYHERVVRSVANSTRADVHALLELAAAAPLETAVETFPLERANEALAALEASRIRGAGVLLLD